MLRDKMLKLGFDVHGVVDTFPQIRDLMHICHDMGSPAEVHIITGMTFDTAKQQLEPLFPFGCPATKFFSIVEHLEKEGEKVEWRDGLPYADADKWDRAKSEYCKREGINIMFDDSPTYAKYFDEIDTLYCHVLNPNRKLYNTRKPA